MMAIMRASVEAMIAFSFSEVEGSISLPDFGFLFAVNGPALTEPLRKMSLLFNHSL